MTSYNTSFDLNPHDIDLIETALQTQRNELSNRRLRLIADGTIPANAALAQIDSRLTDISQLMGRLHNQKVFFRPKHKPYVSG